MAKKKTEKGLEQMLKEALIKEDEQPYAVPGNWEWVYLLSGGADCLDQHRKPVNANERAIRKGNVPYYGATGQVGWIDDYLTNEELVLVGEDGAPFLDMLKKKAYMISGKAWVNNHAHILRSLYGSSGNRFLEHYLNNFDYNGYVSGTTRLKLTQKSLKMMPFSLPSLPEQKRIIQKLSSMLDKLKEARELIREAKETFEERRAAILNKAFAGEVTKKWREENPDVESAGEFLEGIRLIRKKNNLKPIKAKTFDNPHIPQQWLSIQLDVFIES
ncbi:MAG: restriction endonuclease subunit S, partial [Desulfobacterales bacterium]